MIALDRAGSFPERTFEVRDWCPRLATIDSRPNQ
jgi:hypothetical protein